MNLERLGDAYGRVVRALLWTQHPLLLAIRVYWGWSLMIDGWGKMHHIAQIAAWFGNDLHIPFPTVNAWMAAGTEAIGGGLLVIGLASRPAALAVLITMTVAFLTSDVAVFHTLSTDFWCYDGTKLGDCVVLSAPFPYWFMAILVLVLGPGLLAADGVIGIWWRRRFGRIRTLPRPWA